MAAALSFYMIEWQAHDTYFCFYKLYSTYYIIRMKYNSTKSYSKEGITWQKEVDCSRFFAGIAGREQNIQSKAGKVYG